jgi:hypothetical protein
VLLLELAEELLRHLFDIKGRADPARDFDQADVPILVELADVEDHLAELAHEQVARLALDIEMISGIDLTVLPLGPVPEALSALLVEEDQDVLVMVLGDFLVDRRACLRVRDMPVSLGRADFEHRDPGKLGDLLAFEPMAARLKGDGVPAQRLRPAEFLREQPLEVELLEEIFHPANIERHGYSGSPRD